MITRIFGLVVDCRLEVILRCACVQDMYKEVEGLYVVLALIVRSPALDSW